MNLTKLYISIAVFLFLASCAQVGSLTGGKKDKEPPVLLKSTPEKQSLNFKGNKLTFKFDEYFVLSNLNSVFICSPPLDEKPDFKVKGKKFIVKFNEKLKDSTTYMLWFANALQDNNEKNPYKDFKFVFSTGNKIDTMEISGVVKDAFTNKPEEEMYVLLYKNYNDSSPIIEKPYYIAKTDTSGKFTIDFIKEGKYRIFALKDLDANLQFNLPNEKIAYIDSFIIPKVITETKIDTFKAGSVIFDGDKKVGDTLINDTVIIQNEYIYSPQNITLFSFEEDNNKQYVVNSSRDLMGKCKFEFNQIADSVFISALNFDLKNEDYYVEKTDTGKSLVYWIKEKELYKKDTLTFLTSCFNKDSLGITETETDTISFPFNFEKDTLQKFVELNEFILKQDSFANYLIEGNTPISKFDTSNIKLFEILDTLVADTKTQKLLKAKRPEPNKLFFKLERPYIKDFYIEGINIDTSKVWHSKSYSEDSTELTCNIIENTILQKDTLKVILHYDNLFFKGQIQKMADTLIMPLNKQEIIIVKRPATDTIKITFRKRISKETNIYVDEYEKVDWYNRLQSEDDNIFKLKITKKEIEQKDTIIFTVKTKDYENTSGNRIEIEYSKKAIFRFDKQKIKKAAREERNRFYFIFRKPLHNNFKITPLNFNPKNQWFDKEINDEKDTVVYTINSRTIANIDTIKLKFEYEFKNKFKEIETVTDSINFVYKRVRERRKRTAKKQNKKSDKKETSKKEETKSEKLTKVEINIPLQYKIIKDSTSERKINIAYPWNTGKSYILKMDSLAFFDIYNNYSAQTETKFEIRKASSYCQLKISLQNINKISKDDFYLKEDTSNTDTLISSNLEKGQILLTLYDEKNNIIKTKITNSDSSFIISKLIPGKYSLKMIYDINNNKKWDTGKFIKHIQAEKVINYSEEIEIKEGEEKEILWEL